MIYFNVFAFILLKLFYCIHRIWTVWFLLGSTPASRVSWSQHRAYITSNPQFHRPHTQLYGQHFPLNNGSVLSLTTRSTPAIDFDEAWEYFMRQDMSHVKVCLSQLQSIAWDSRFLF